MFRSTYLVHFGNVSGDMRYFSMEAGQMGCNSIGLCHRRPYVAFLATVSFVWTRSWLHTSVCINDRFPVFTHLYKFHGDSISASMNARFPHFIHLHKYGGDCVYASMNAIFPALTIYTSMVVTAPLSTWLLHSPLYPSTQVWWWQHLCLHDCCIPLFTHLPKYGDDSTSVYMTAAFPSLPIYPSMVVTASLSTWLLHSPLYPSAQVWWWQHLCLHDCCIPRFTHLHQYGDDSISVYMTAAFPSLPIYPSMI